MKYSIISKVVKMVIAFLTVITIVAAFFFLSMKQQPVENKNREMVLALNEIEKLTEKDGISPVKEQIDKLSNTLLKGDQNSETPYLDWIVFLYACCVGFVLTLFAYLYRVMLHPFRKLEQYAGEIAKGNMNISLNYERNNFFGAFTWSFDHMRKEIVKARACEKEAIENNKTVIATLSHDIKTPIASIRAYAEGLEANMDSSPERRARYLRVLMKKCDEVTNLTNDLFLHSLSDLDKLQVRSEPVELSNLIHSTVDEMLGDQGDIQIKNIDRMRMDVDSKRLVQVIENVINNARKYGSPPISVWTKVTDFGYEIHIMDYGKGISSEDMPFVFHKFYRGKNAEGKPGSGLGLYIVDYIMKQMNGEVLLNNTEKGLEVIIFLKS